MQDKQFDEDLNETERNAWLSFKRICKDFLQNHKAANYYDVVQHLLNCTKLLDAIWVWKFTSWSHTWIFSQKISAKSVTYTMKDFIKILWLWKSGTKASVHQVCWQNTAGHWRWMYLTPNAGEIHKPLHFRGKFLPVLLARKVLFCTYKFLCKFGTLPDKKILCTYLNSA